MFADIYISREAEEELTLQVYPGAYSSSTRIAIVVRATRDSARFAVHEILYVYEIAILFLYSLPNSSADWLFPIQS